MTARIYTDQSLAAGDSISLPPTSARHVQVLRFQPGNALTLFNGRGQIDADVGSDAEGEYNATIQSMGRSDVQVLVGNFVATEREAKKRGAFGYRHACQRADGLAGRKSH